MSIQREIINLGVGEPDFHTAEDVKEAGRRAIKDNITKYGPQPGLMNLREAAAEKFREENGISVSPERVVISYGAKHALYNLFQVFLKPGDEVILFHPYWMAYPEQIICAHGVPVYVPGREERGYQPDVEEAGNALTEKTRAMIINSPTNPTGAVYSRDALEGLAALACEHDLLVISDEVYEKILYDGAVHYSIAGLGGEIADRSVTINSVSKTHAMTGWRVGFGAYPLEIAEKISHLQSHSTSGVSGILQNAALHALVSNREAVARMIDEYARRRADIWEKLKGIEQLSCVKPLGTFYFFINISLLLGRHSKGRTISGADDFCRLLEDEAGVIVISGSHFGSNDHIRLSFAASLDSLREAVDRLNVFVDSLT